jgi:predicted porin
VYSASAVYNNGPLAVFGAYEKHKDVTGVAAARSESGWTFGGAYTFANQLKLGGLYTRQTWERGTAAAPTEGRVNAWHIGIDWTISGPHGMRAAYTRAGDIKNNLVAPFAGIGAGVPPYRPAFNAAGATGAQLYQIRYVLAVSKRTEFTAGYAKMDNKTNAAYQLYGLSANANGRDQSAFAFALDHKF